MEYKSFDQVWAEQIAMYPENNTPEGRRLTLEHYNAELLPRMQALQKGKQQAALQETPEYQARAAAYAQKLRDKAIYDAQGRFIPREKRGAILHARKPGVRSTQLDQDWAKGGERYRERKAWLADESNRGAIPADVWARLFANTGDDAAHVAAQKALMESRSEVSKPEVLATVAPATPSVQAERRIAPTGPAPWKQPKETSMYVPGRDPMMGPPGYTTGEFGWIGSAIKGIGNFIKGGITSVAGGGPSLPIPGTPGWGGPTMPPISPPARTGMPIHGPPAPRVIPTMNLPAPTAGVVPSGYRLNKTDYWLKDGTFVPKGTRLVKIRRRNSLNPRAASRALARIDGLRRAMARVEKRIPTKTSVRRICFRCSKPKGSCRCK